MKEPIWFQTILGAAQLAIGEPVGGLLWCDFRNLARAEITFGNVRSFDVEHFDGRVYRCIWICTRSCMDVCRGRERYFRRSRRALDVTRFEVEEAMTAVEVVT